MKMNLPNKLTLLRCALVPFFMVFAAMTKFGTQEFDKISGLTAGMIFALASITDLLDGKIARKYHLETDFGRFADPLADKMLTTAALIYMVVDGVCSPIVLALTLFREFAVAGIRMVAASKTILLYYGLTAVAGGSDAMGVSIIIQALCWAVAVVTVVSGVIYVKDNIDVIK